MNCASQSCPALAPVPYATASLDAALDNATRAYLASPEGMRADGNGVSVTKLVEWYEADFGGKDGVKAFLLKYGHAAGIMASKRIV